MNISFRGCLTCRSYSTALLSILIVVAPVHAQSAGNPFALVPARQRSLLKKRLTAYTEAFRTKDWGTLYGLVPDLDKIPVENGKDKVSKDAFIRDMQGSSDWQRLVKFRPVRTEAGFMGFDVYGCAEIPYGNQKLKRIAAVRAVWEHDNWYFTTWAYAYSPEPCSNLSNPAWKPELPLRLDGPMSQLTCDLFTCEL
jgi:hypothetical protein